MKKVNFVAALIAVAMTMAIVSCGSNASPAPSGADSVVSPGVQDTLVADTLIVSPDTLK